MLGLYIVYRVGRLAAGAREAEAIRNADLVHRLEHWLHLPPEVGLQHLALKVPDLLQLANIYYVNVHFPVAIAFLIWGDTRRPRAEYTWARNLLGTLTLFALAAQLVFPLAPPRMFAQWGFQDTMATIGPSAYVGVGATVANQYAAMPSLHIGWALVIALVVHRTGPSTLRLLTKAHAVATILVVVITANHWWLDGVVAVALLLLAVILLPALPHPAAPDSDLAQDTSAKPGAATPETTMLPPHSGERMRDPQRRPTGSAGVAEHPEPARSTFPRL